ncbi:LINE-1 retrotransposable element ORF1 protein [Plecturocebus cupreus]
MKEKMLRAAREKGWVTHKGKPIRLTADLSAETLQARREWGPTFNILKENNFQPRISYPAKLSFISEGKIKFFANKQVLRDYITTRPPLQELLKEALHMDGNNQYQPFQKHTKRDRDLLCHPSWNAVAQSELTVISNFWAQANLPCKPPKALLGLQKVSLFPGWRAVAQSRPTAIPCLPGSSNSPASASQYRNHHPQCEPGPVCMYHHQPDTHHNFRPQLPHLQSEDNPDGYAEQDKYNGT